MEDNKNRPLKRQRDEIGIGIENGGIEKEEEEEETLKRQKSFKDIITLLDEEEDFTNGDLSSLISTLQDEISSAPDPDNRAGSPEEGERVMRHLLEASDDELGIPSTDGSDAAEGVGGLDGGDLLFPFGGGDGIWEFEDHEAANYYSLLQSEILM